MKNFSVGLAGLLFFGCVILKNPIINYNAEEYWNRNLLYEKIYETDIERKKGQIYQTMVISEIKRINNTINKKEICRHTYINEDNSNFGGLIKKMTMIEIGLDDNHNKIAEEISYFFGKNGEKEELTETKLDFVPEDGVVDLIIPHKNSDNINNQLIRYIININSKNIYKDNYISN